MGLDVHSYTILGIRIKREDLFTYTGMQRKCIGCLQIFTDENIKFCPYDGHKISSINVEEPTPKFAQYCKEKDVTPESCWEDLRDKSFYKNEVGICRIEQMQTAEERAKHKYAIGFRIGETDSHRSGYKAECASIPLSSLDELSKSILKEAGKIGLEDDELEIFTCAYFSY